MSATLSSTNKARSSSPLAQWSFSDSAMQRSSRLLLKRLPVSKDGTGTNRLRLTNPTLFSTDPFSCPAFGLQKEKAKP